MKKFYSGLAVLLLVLIGITTEGYSVPAYPGKVDVKQKDGSIITIELHGDEFFNYATTTDGYVISSVDGNYYYTDIAFDGSRSISKIRANNPSRRTQAERAAIKTRPLAASLSYLGTVSTMTRAQKNSSGATTRSEFPLEGEVKSIAILVNFKDVKFTSQTANEDYRKMLNDENYSTNGGTGSAKDFYMDNSMGKFNPDFTVVGPVEISKNMMYYGVNDSNGMDANPHKMIIEACAAAEASGTNFADFDFDGDGIIDNVFVYYAGYNEAEHGPEDSVWPHKHQIPGNNVYSGKRLYKYACSSELKGNSGANMAGIGTFTHEFGHVLGLADIYDTGTGNSEGLFSLNTMNSGSYNNEGRTPPYFMAFERYQLGWLTPTELTEKGPYTLKDISQNEAYVVRTSVDNEYVLLEFRNNKSTVKRNWDKYISSSSTVPGLNAHGMTATHIDKSSNSVGGKSAKSRWAENGPNNYIEHECAKFVFSGGFKYPSNVNELRSNAHKAFYPGKNNVTTFGYNSAHPATDWAGKPLIVNLENIRIEGDVVKFTNNVTDYTVKPETNIAKITFNKLEAKWQIKWKMKTATEYTTVEKIDYSNFIIGGLAPASEYEIQFSKLTDGGTYVLDGEMTFTTKAISSDFPTMFINTDSGSMFNAELNNFTGDVKNVKWLNNGKEVKNDLTGKLSEGKNEIICEISNNGKIDRIYQTIKK